MPISLLLVDSRPVVRAGIKSLLANTPVEVIGEADSVDEGVTLATELRPNVAMIDARINKRDGLEFLSRLRSSSQLTPTIVFTEADNPTYAARASALGAVGYLRSDIHPEQLLRHLHTAAEGGTCWSDKERHRLTGRLLINGHEAELAAPLTRRELEVLKQLSFGLNNRDIGKALGISYETVKEHVQHVLRKLGVGDRTQAAVWVVRRGLV